MLVFEERNLSEQSKEPTTKITHIGGRRLSHLVRIVPFSHSGRECKALQKIAVNGDMVLAWRTLPKIERLPCYPKV